MSRDGRAWAELDVAADARSLRGRGSSIELVSADCGRPERRHVFRLASQRRGLRVRRGQRFVFSRRDRGAGLRVSGRFQTRNTLALRIRRTGRCDERRTSRLTLHRVRRGGSAGCGQRGRTLRWTPRGRLFQRAVYTGDEHVPYVNHAFGCLFARGRAVHLDEDQDPDSDLRAFRLAGHFAAYAQDACPMGCGYGVFVVDLRTGRKLRRVGVGTEGGRGGPASDLELAANGSLAWIVAGATVEVRSYGARGERLLDSGPGIERTSLALSNLTLTWVKSGIVRSALLD